MRVRKPKNQVSQVVERNLSSLQDLPPLEKYKTGMTERKRDSWFSRARLYLRAFLAEGLTREECKTRLNLNDSMYDRLENELIETDAEKLCSMSIPQKYYIYMLQMEHVIRQLDYQISSTIGDPDKTASVVTALKAKANFFKEMITVGQDLGVVAKRAKDTRVLGEIVLTRLDTDELQELMLEKMRQFTELVEAPPALPNAFEQMLDRVAESKTDDYIEAEYAEEPL